MKHFTEELDKIAEEIQEQDPIVALALDCVSDSLENRESFIFNKKPKTDQPSSVHDEIKKRFDTPKSPHTEEKPRPNSIKLEDLIQNFKTELKKYSPKLLNDFGDIIKGLSVVHTGLSANEK